jgi:hypothetical protein
VRFAAPVKVDINSLHAKEDGCSIPVEWLMSAVIPNNIGDPPPILEYPPEVIFATPNGEIVYGVMRWKALKLAGAKKVWVSYQQTTAIG